MIINKRYTISDMVNMRFYKMPKFLFSPEYEKLSNNSKLLYMLLLDRLELSLKNNWVNEDGEVYIKYSRSNMCNELRLSRPTITNSMKELVIYNLLQEEVMTSEYGRAANRIYLLTINLNHGTTEEVSNMFREHGV
ncbi:MAG: replication initiator protein A [Oscillospiraceae bacterium]|nr:replication initiator protein A [Oscillospiraceae bacterium]MCL2277916.1 replication initiator protein A [Oscillospiraceae bacterium]